MENRTNFLKIGLLFSFLTLCPLGCGPKTYSFADYETYLRPELNTDVYKRVAVLYVGYTYTSKIVQKDRGNQKGGGAGDNDATASDTEAYAQDVLLFSNALATAFSKRGVTLVERNRVNDLVREQGLGLNELMDLSDKGKVQRLGKLLKADLIVKGDLFIDTGAYWVTDGGFLANIIPGLGGKQYFLGSTGLTVSAIDTTTGQVVWVDTMRVDRYINPKDMKRVAKSNKVSKAAMVSKMVNAMVSRLYGEPYGEKRGAS